jgi:hypothetical protein
MPHRHSPTQHPTQIKRLQVVQNKALKTIYNTPFYTNLTKLHSNINIPTLVEYIHKLTDKYYPKTDYNHNLLIKNLFSKLKINYLKKKRSKWWVMGVDFCIRIINSSHLSFYRDVNDTIVKLEYVDVDL